MQGNKQIKEVGVTGIMASFTVESDFIIALRMGKALDLESESLHLDFKLVLPVLLV